MEYRTNASISEELQPKQRLMKVVQRRKLKYFEDVVEHKIDHMHLARSHRWQQFSWKINTDDIKELMGTA